MTQRKADSGLDFEVLRRGIERCDPDLVLGFYAADALLSIVNAESPHASLLELRGSAEIAKHLRTVFGPGTTHRVERALFFLPFCFFAYRRSLWDIVLTILALVTSMFWFPAPKRTCASTST